MKILIADDSSTVRALLSDLLWRWGHELIVAKDGGEAWRLIQSEGPKLAVLDWVMPEPDGLELCHRIRTTPPLKNLYVLMLSGLSETKDVVAGLNAGANDFLTKPFKEEELQARINVGVRMVDLQAALAARISELETALKENIELRDLLPICAYCKSVRTDQNYWQSVEHYFGEHADVKFTHGVCPRCLETVVKPEIEKLGLSRRAGQEKKN